MDETNSSPGYPEPTPRPTRTPTRKRWSVNPLTAVLVVSGLFFVLFVSITGVLSLQKVGSGSHSKGGFPFGGSGKGAVGVVELEGIILDSKPMLKRLKEMEEDTGVAAVVMRLDSPGGAVAPSQEIYEAVKAFKKPLVVSMGSTAASGAYYIACASKKVFANAGTITGSIGVLMQFMNMERLYEWAKVRPYALTTGKFKDAGAPYKEMKADERKLFQDMIDDVLGQFKQAVSEGRNMPMPRVDLIADGRIFSGRQAKTANLIDELGTIRDATLAAAKEAGIEGEPRVIYPSKRRERLMEFLFNSDWEEESGFFDGFISRMAKGIFGASGRVLDPGVYLIWNPDGR